MAEAGAKIFSHKVEAMHWEWSKLVEALGPNDCGVHIVAWDCLPGIL